MGGMACARRRVGGCLFLDTGNLRSLSPAGVRHLGEPRFVLTRPVVRTRGGRRGALRLHVPHDGPQAGTANDKVARVPVSVRKEQNDKD